MLNMSEFQKAEVCGHIHLRQEYSLCGNPYAKVRR